ncbi:hypothetical protein Btru_051018 [Bulinus truncatus]|nr:hypothetical protein Btru_051018 [Bulinus truncatus]
MTPRPWSRARLLGDKCTSNETCAQTVTNSICLNTTCACSPGYWAQSSARCVRRQIGDECNKSSECSATVVHGTCSPSKVCACETGYKNTSDGACSQNLVGDSCKTNEDCNKVLSGRSKCNKICECVGTFISNANKTRCVERVLGDQCRKDNACSSIRNFVCLSNKCSCNITYKPDARSRCVPRELGDACDSDAECTHGGAENVRCDGNTCECTEGYTREGKHACRLQYMIYSQCSNDSFCQSLYRNTVCTFPCASNGSCAGNYSGSCECEEGYYNSNNECVTNGIGAGCNSDNDCTVEGTACGTSSVCTCRHTHLLSRDSTKCVVKKIGGLACTSDANCSLSTPHSFCNGSVCACMVGYSPNDQFDQCLPKRLLDSCSLDEECSKLNLNSFCSNESRTCECLPGFYMERQSQGDNSTSSLCVERVIGLHLCDSDVDCLATATNSTCVTCGDDASSDRLCQQLACRNSSTRTIDKRCSGKTCLCMRGFTVNQKKTRCRPMELRDKCFHDDECTVHVPRSLCHEGQCRCMSGYRFNILTECRKCK